MKSRQLLSLPQFAWRSMTHYWRVNLAVVLGIATATAVLTGALVVGDSVRLSLRHLTLDRLGNIHLALLADHFFAAEQPAAWQLDSSPLPEITHAVPAILLPQATLEQRGDNLRRANQVTIVGAEESFWQLQASGLPRPTRAPTAGQLVVNEPLAKELEVAVGDRVTVRLPGTARIAADSPLGDKEGRIESLIDLEVIEVLPAQGLASFSLRPNQAQSRTAFLNLTQLQATLNQPAKVNAILVAGQSAEIPPSEDAIAQLRQRVRFSLADAGVSLNIVDLSTRPAPEEPSPAASFRYLHITVDTMMMSQPLEEAIRANLADFTHQTVLTYLANSIAKVSPTGSLTDPTSIPYSTVAAVESGPELTPLLDEAGAPLPPLGNDGVILNQWAADDLGAVVGDRIALRYFAPETTHGEAREESAEFRLVAIAPLARPASPFVRGRAAEYVGKRPRTNDPSITPSVPGITDQASIDDWDPPFPFDYRRIRKPRDEDYWDEYRTTPKAFVSKTTGERLWGSRFGKTTSLRIALRTDNEMSVVETRLLAAIQSHPAAFGFHWLPVKQDGLRASQGTTPFNLLFLGFSMFIIVAALMLVSLLFRLMLEQRSPEVGLLMAVGLTRPRVTHFLSAEGLGLSMAGALLGTLLGIGYASLMLWGLRTWWLDAVVTPFLRLYLVPSTLPLGMGVGLATSLLTIRLSLAAIRHRVIVNLLSKRIENRLATPQQADRSHIYRLILWILAIAAAGSGPFLEGEVQAGAFFAAGALVLAALLWQLVVWLRGQTRANAQRTTTMSLSRLMRYNLSRNPTRSALTAGLMATACFLIVAISAFRLAPTSAGTGGFELLAQSDVGIFTDLSDEAARATDWGGQDGMEAVQILPLRLQAGDDASCRNLYQAQRPRLLGITPSFVARYDQDAQAGFAWAGTAAEQGTPAQRNPWRLLLPADRPAGTQPIPVVLDKNTAMYSLHLYGGVGEVFTVDYGESQPLQFQVVGLLANSVFQGSLLVAEADLVAKFPGVSGYQFFCIDCPLEQQRDVAARLMARYTDEGLVTTDASVLLADLLAVQNTYLSTFQSLGGLGLLLGTFGMIAVQMRNVMERRGELALLRATGFGVRRLQRLVLGEHFLLLLGGLGIGLAAALVAVLPHAITTHLSPPWFALGGILAAILLVGTLSGILTLRPMVRAPIVQALRGD